MPCITRLCQKCLHIQVLINFHSLLDTSSCKHRFQLFLIYRSLSLDNEGRRSFKLSILTNWFFFRMYHILLHFKFTLLTVINKSTFTFLLDEPGGVASSRIVSCDVSIGSLSRRFVYNIFTTREVLLSLESNTIFWVIHLSTGWSFRFPLP